MKAVVCSKYGGPEALQIKEVDKPAPRDNEILVKVYATTVTVGDTRLRSFNVPPLFWLAGRIALGFTKPKCAILGMELAGEVEAVGGKVTRFKAGDQIFGATGHNFGAYAEYCRMSEDDEVAHKPANMTFEEAAAVPVGSRTALHFLKSADIRSGQKVLINGASGSVGTYAVQLAKYFGAEVTGVCGPANLDMVKSLGADMVIDYTKEDFTRNGQVYDIIFDTVGKTSFSQCNNSLKEKGYYLHTVMVLAEVVSLWYLVTTGKKVVGGTFDKSVEELVLLKELIEGGKIKAVIDRIYPLERIAEAHEYTDQGHKRGNVVIKVNQ